MGRLPYYVLLSAAVPAIGVSIWLLHVAQAPRSLLIQQIAVIIVGAVIVGILLRICRRASSLGQPWLVLALTTSLFLPLLVSSQHSPKRWLSLGVGRLYVGPTILPLLVFLLGTQIRSTAICAICPIAAAIALVLQPDAAQLTAFSLAMLFVLLLVPSIPRRVGLAVSAALVCFAILAWRISDPLTPVRYVESVFHLAAEMSVFSLILAIISAALPVIALIWIARAAASNAILAVAFYYACLFAMAPLQVTPVPLLGFGAGPIFGYVLVAGAISHTIIRKVEPSHDLEHTKG